MEGTPRRGRLQEAELELPVRMPSENLGVARVERLASPL